MWLTLAATLLTTTAMTAQTDTTFAVRHGARLNVNNFGGQIAIQAWSKKAVRIEAQHSRRVRIEIAEIGPNVEVRAISRSGNPLPRVNYQIAVPAWMALILSGVNTDISVQGSRGEVTAETVKGEVSLHGGSGLIKLSSVQGPVSVVGAKGRLELTSVNDGVNVIDVEGELTVDAVNGDVVLERVDSDLVEAVTVNGDVTYLGAFRDNGRYRFSTHNGDLVLAIPEEANATFSIATFNGEFDSTFPVQFVQSRRGKQFQFTLGSGSAQIDLESFEGSIQLRRASKVKFKEK